jgi:flavin-binding protein dodecin
LRGEATTEKVGGAGKMNAKETGTVKILELLARSDESWEEATKVALRKASETVSNIQTIYIKEFLAVVENGEIVDYQINAKVTFLEEG